MARWAAVQGSASGYLWSSVGLGFSPFSVARLIQGQGRPRLAKAGPWDNPSVPTSSFVLSRKTSRGNRLLGGLARTKDELTSGLAARRHCTRRGREPVHVVR